MSSKIFLKLSLSCGKETKPKYFFNQVVFFFFFEMIRVARKSIWDKFCYFYPRPMCILIPNLCKDKSLYYIFFQKFQIVLNIYTFKFFKFEGESMSILK